MKTLDVVLQVTDFFGKLAADGLDAVDFREDGLKFVKSAESLLNRKGLVVLFCSIAILVYVDFYFSDVAHRVVLGT